MTLIATRRSLLRLRMVGPAVKQSTSCRRLVSGRIETVYDVVDGFDAIYVVTEFIDTPTVANRVGPQGARTCVYFAIQALS
jgi:hypothetical protein